MEEKSFIKLRKDYYSHQSGSITKKLKESIFGVIFVLLKDEETFELLEGVLFIFEFLEFMIFPFNPEIKSVWQNDSFTDTLSNAFGYITFLAYFEGRSPGVYLGGLYASILCMTLVLFNIGYVSYSFSRKYFTATWPLYLLRTIAKVFVTGLFMPLLEVNLSIFNCFYSEEKGYYINDAARDMKCFTAIHFVHMGISLIVSIVFVLISVFVALTFFENSEFVGGDTAKENSRADFAILISKIVSIFISTFFRAKNYQWFVIILNFSFSVFQVVKMYIDRPYYNFKQMGLIMCLNGIYMWSNFMLLVCKFFSMYQFEGGFYIWLIGCPIVGFYFYCGTDESKRVLSKDINLCKTGEEVQRHLRYFLTTCEHLNQRDENNMTLQGYIFNHSCNDPLCGICELKKDSSLNGNCNAISQASTQLTKKYLYAYAENIYIKEISRYPNSTSLRIAYAMFLYERKNEKAVALQQLTFAKKYNPLFDEEFIIYRYSKMINEENERLYHTNNLNSDQFEEEEELDIVSSIAYDSHFRLCLHNIKRSAELYISFWEKIINSSNQDLTTLNEMAMNINAANKNIEIHWKNMLDIKPNDPKAFKIYGGYVKNVLNNKDKGNELMAIGYETSDKKPNSVGYLNFEIDEEYVHLAKEGNSFVICSMEDEKVFGNILKCSKTAVKFFGFSEKEIISNKNIKNLFLECYNKSILLFIKNELNKNVDAILQCQQYLMFIKHKSNKPQAVNVIFRKYKGNYFQEKCFLAIFLYDNENRENLKNYIKNVYFIIDQDLKIRYITQASVDLLNKLNRKLPDDYGNFGKLFPEFDIEADEEDNQMNNNVNVVNNVNSGNNNNNNVNKSNSNNNVITNSVSITAENQYVILNQHMGCKIKVSHLEGYISEDNKLYVVKLQTIPTSKINQNQTKQIKMKPNFIYPKLTYIQKKLLKQTESENGDNNISIQQQDQQHIHTFESKVSNFYEFSSVEKPKNIVIWNAINNLLEPEESHETSNNNSSSNQERESSKRKQHTKRNNNNKCNYSLSENSEKEEDYYEEIKDNVLPLAKNDQNESAGLLKNKHLYDSLSAEEFKKKLENLKNYGRRINYYIIKIKKNEIEKVEHFYPKVVELVKDKKQTLTITDSMQLNRGSDLSKMQNNFFNQKNKVYLKVQNLGYISLLVILIFLAYTVIDYWWVQRGINHQINNFQMINISFELINHFQLSEMFLKNLILTNQPLFNNTHGLSMDDFRQKNFDKINQHITSLSEIHRNITLKAKHLLKEHKVLFEEKTVAFITTYENYRLVKEEYTFLHAFQMQINLLLSLLSLDVSRITFNCDYVEEFLYNNINEFYISAIQSINLFKRLIDQTVDTNILEDTIFCIVNFILSIIVIVLMYQSITSIETERTKMLKSFYKIPKFYLRNLATKSKIFIQKIEKYIINSEDEDNQNKSNDEDGENNSINSEFNEKDELKGTNSSVDTGYYSGTTNSSKSTFAKNLSFLIKSILVVVFLLAYFSASFITNTLSSFNTKTLNSNFYYNSFYYVNASSLYNMLHGKIIDSNKKVLLSRNLELLNETFAVFSHLSNDISESNSDSYFVYNDDLSSSLSKLKTGDVCLIKEFQDEVVECESKLNYIGKFGLNVLKAEFTEELTKALEDVYDCEKNNLTLDDRVMVLNGNKYSIMYVIINDYLKAANDFWKNKLISFIKDFLNKQKNINVIILIVFEILVFCGYLFFWVPFLLGLKESVSLIIIIIYDLILFIYMYIDISNANDD